MYRYTAEKKLSNPKKAWKRLVSSFQSKLVHFNKSNHALTSRTNHNRLSRWNTAFSRHPNIYHHHHYHYHRHYHSNEKQVRPQKIVPSVKLCIEAAVSVDDIHLCQDIETRVEREVSAPSMDDKVLTTTVATLSAEQQTEKNVEEVDQLTSIESAFMALRLHGVDEKAEEFIQRNKEAWRIERQKSAEEYFAMLARGA
ncbi:DUF761 domain protein [Melia azedarach]|uniref:DUF761 domain protein n=1 Tax=Melia azedarach TaxID=155640 RepID=A0ACC1YN29_MELAZ|nr:DUF761 domain protein [Melia azedarach]